MIVFNKQRKNIVTFNTFAKNSIFLFFYINSSKKIIMKKVVLNKMTDKKIKQYIPINIRII